MTSPDNLTGDHLDKALAAVRKRGQRPARFSLMPADYRAVTPWLGAPKSPNANASFRGVPVFYAPNAGRSNLWVRAGDGQLGDLLAVPLAEVVA